LAGNNEKRFLAAVNLPTFRKANPLNRFTKSRLLSPFALLLSLLFLGACRDSRIKERDDWGARFRQYGIDSACFMLRDHSHESVHMFNKDRCLQRFSPASTFKIMNALVALETGAAPDDALVIPWDKGARAQPEWNRDMDMREAFRVSNVPYFQEIARRIGRQNMQHFLDTVKYGNMKIGSREDEFWLDGSLQISADEQVGLMKKLYFDELPFIVRNQSIVRTMMLREDSANNRLYYKTGAGTSPKGNQLFWVVGFLEHSLRVKENEKSMNKTGVRNYPYFFALNFEVPKGDSSRNWPDVRIKLLHDLLEDYGANRDD
jgi:beta-lactamase class D